jgi:O-antigen ligase
MKLSLSQLTLSAITVLVIMLPFINTSEVAGFNFHRIAELIIISVAMIYVVFNNIYQLEKNYVGLSVLAIVVLGLVSSYLSPSPRYAVLEISLFYGLLCSVFVVASVTTSENSKTIRIISIALLFAAGFHIVGVLAAYSASLIEGIPIMWYHLFYGYSSVRFFNQFQIWTFPLVLLAYISIPKEYKFQRGFVVALISFWWMLLFLATSRGAFLAVFLAMITTLIIYRGIAKKIIWLQVIFAIVGYICYLVLFKWLPTFSLYGEQLPAQLSELTRTGSVIRFQLWQDTLSMIKDNPWFGVGPMHFAWYPNSILPDPRNNYMQWGVGAAHPHSSVLQWAAEWGVPSLILMLNIIFYGLFRWLQRFNVTSLVKKSELDQLIPMALFCSFIAGLGYSLVSGVIVMPQSQLMLVLIAGLMLGRYHCDGKGLPNKSNTSTNLIFRGSSIIFLAALWFSVWPSVVERLSTIDIVDTRVMEVNGPRFWQRGGIPHE